MAKQPFTVDLGDLFPGDSRSGQADNNSGHHCNPVFLFVLQNAQEKLLILSVPFQSSLTLWNA